MCPRPTRESVSWSAGPTAPRSTWRATTRRDPMPDHITDEVIERAFNRRGFIGAVGATAFLAACGGSTTAPEAGNRRGCRAGPKNAPASGSVVAYHPVRHVQPRANPAVPDGPGAPV